MAGALADVVVVGGGTSGCALAARLSDDPGCDVLLLEAGPDDDAYDDRVRDPNRAVELFGGGGVAEAFTMGGISMVRGTGLGGTSAVNFLVAMRPKADDLDGWGLPGWSWAEVEPAVERAEATLGVQPLATRSRLAEAFLAGVPDAEPLRAARHPNGERRTVSQAYLTPEVRARPNLTIRTRAPVRSLDEVDGETIVIACGATRTPGLLQRAGIECGAGLQDHLGVSILYRHPGPAGPRQAPGEVLWDGGDVHLIPIVVAEDSGATTISLMAFLLDLDDRGSVYDGVVTPQQRGPRDVERLATLLTRVRAWEASEPAQALGLERLGDLPDPTTAPLMSYGHQASTCAMGTVLDERCRVRGAEHVRVVDASAMPTLVRATPYLTVVAMAEHMALDIRDGRPGNVSDRRSDS